MTGTRAADRVALYGTRAETSDLWATILGDRRAASAVAELGRELRVMPVAQLERLPHMGKSRAAKVFAAVELGRRLAAMPLRRGHAITGPQSVLDAYGQRLMDLQRESVWSLYLDVRNRVICDELIGLGSVTQCPASAGDVIRGALRVVAVGIILIHAHTSSGDPQPSAEDHALTHALFRASGIMGLQLLDHVIIGDGRYYSFAEHGTLPT